MRPHHLPLRTTRSRTTPAWRRTVGASVLAFGVMAMLVGCGRGPAPEAATGITVFQPGDRVEMPDIAGADLDGRPLALAELRGQIVVLNSWASWCAPCRDEIPLLRAAAIKHPNVAFLGLNVEDDERAAHAFATDTGASWPSIVDKDGTILPTIPGVPPAALPSTVVLDTRGRIAVRIIGPVKGEELSDALASLATEESA